MSPCKYARAVTLSKREVRCVDALSVVWADCRSREAVRLHMKVLFWRLARKAMAPCVEMSPCVFARAVTFHKREVRCVDALYVGWDACRSREAVRLHMKVLFWRLVRENDGLMCRDEPVCIRQGCKLA